MDEQLWLIETETGAQLWLTFDSIEWNRQMGVRFSVIGATV